MYVRVLTDSDLYSSPADVPQPRLCYLSSVSAGDSDCGGEGSCFFIKAIESPVIGSDPEDLFTINLRLKNALHTVI